MPLARILTAFPERAESLAQQLREKGYNVEFLSPEKAGMLRADLEIDFEICNQKVVLRRAAELANKLHADIAVSPEALPANFAGPESEIYVSENEIVEVPSHIADPFVETFLGQGERSAEIRHPEQPEQVIALPPDMLAAEKNLSKEKIQAEPPSAVTPEQPIHSDPVHNTDVRNADLLNSNAVPIVPDPERHAEGSYGFETHGFATQDQQLNQAANLQDEPQQAVHTAKPEWVERAGALSSSALEAAKQKSAGLAASARRFGADCAEWINLRMAAARDARHQRQIEAEKQRELARARAEELEIARDAAAARLQELLRERGGLTENQPTPPPAVPMPAYRSDEPQVKPRLNQVPTPSLFARFKETVVSRRYGQQWEAVLMGVAAACALFVVGVAVNSFRPHPALSNTVTQPSSVAAPVSARATSGTQPYKGVTVKAGSPGVTLLPSPAKAGTPSSAQVATNKPSPKESDVTVRHFNSKLTSRRSDGSIAQDVTIRHFNQQPKPAARNTSDGVKRFSDLD